MESRSSFFDTIDSQYCHIDIGGILQLRLRKFDIRKSNNPQQLQGINLSEQRKIIEQMVLDID